MLAWVGVAFSFLTGVLFLGSSHCLRREKDDEQAKNMQYLMPVSTRSSLKVSGISPRSMDRISQIFWDPWKATENQEVCVSASWH